MLNSSGANRKEDLGIIHKDRFQKLFISLGTLGTMGTLGTLGTLGTFGDVGNEGK
jgi:hypothetical protein